MLAPWRFDIVPLILGILLGLHRVMQKKMETTILEQGIYWRYPLFSWHGDLLVVLR